MKLLNIFLFFFGLSFISCSTISNKEDSENHGPIKNYTLNLIDTISIPINDSTINTGDIYFADLAEGRFVYTIENFDNIYKIFFYNIDNKAPQTFDIRLEKDGPDGVGKIYNSFYVKSLDSVFIVNGASKLLIANRNGNIKSKYNLNLPENIWRPLVNAPAPLDLWNNNLFMGVTVSGPENYYDRILDVSFNLNSQVIKENAPRYPDFMREGQSFGVSSWNFSRKKAGGNHWVYSFMYDPKLYIYTEDSLVKTLTYPSISVGNQELQPVDPNTPMDKQLEYYLSKNQYAELFYDNHTGNIYRVVHLAIDDTQVASGAQWWEKPFVIQIFDKNYNYIGSKEFAGKLYNPRAIFVAKEGLFLPFHNKSNFETDEDKFIFHVFKPYSQDI
jgi:hypothetical protein